MIDKPHGPQGSGPTPGDLVEEMQDLATQIVRGELTVQALKEALLSQLASAGRADTPSSGELLVRPDTGPTKALARLVADVERELETRRALQIRSRPDGWMDSEGAGDGLTDQLLSVDAGVASTDVTPGTTSQKGPQPVEPTPRPPDQETDMLAPLPAARYVTLKSLGTGGQGEVSEMLDRALNRIVALKALREDLADSAARRRAFLAEACLTGQLSHPCIIPIYDVGTLSSGTPCYTMMRIRGRSLREVLAGKRRDERWAAAYSRRRLLDIMVQVAHAIGYAHHRGVVHRDLKPANIMLGSYGQVYVVDWGIAKLVDTLSTRRGEGPLRLTYTRAETRHGIVKGTPTYMAPEQAQAQTSRVGPPTDVHALGLILFEVLTGESARPIGDAAEVLASARQPIRESPEERRLSAGLTVDPIPEEMDQIVMKCLAEDPDDRYPDGEALAEALQQFLEGQRMRELAERYAEEGARQAERMKVALEAAERLKRQLEAARSQVEPWADIVSKRSLWSLEARVQAAEAEREEAMNQAIAAFARAIDNDPTNRRARQGLADIYFDRLCEAERYGRVRDMRRFEAQVRRYDDGRYAEQLEDYGILELETRPESAEVWLHPLEKRDRRLVPARGRRIGRTPVRVERIPTGSYLVVLVSWNGKKTSYPVLIRRQRVWKGTVHLQPNLDEAFVHVPAGPFLYSGDRLAEGSLPREEMWVGDVALARYPVTCAEYLKFLNSLPLDEAMQHVPRASSLKGRTVWWEVKRGRLTIPYVDAGGGKWGPKYPVRAISREDARAYAAWRSRVEGRTLRLPTELEWEKAARGTDARHFPWGNDFDATFCKMRWSRPGRPEPEIVGAFEYDVSPYGVRDMAGGVSEWCDTAFDRYEVMATIKGGHWRSEASGCRLARREAADPDEPVAHTGFRLALEIDSSDGKAPSR